MPKYPKGVAGDVKGTEVKAMFSVEGMTCSACAGSVEKAVKRLPGILEAVVDVLNNRAQVLFYPSSLVNVSMFCLLFVFQENTNKDEAYMLGYFP
jgi:Cu+-exporting ATPase